MITMCRFVIRLKEHSLCYTPLCYGAFQCYKTPVIKVDMSETRHQNIIDYRIIKSIKSCLIFQNMNWFLYKVLMNQWIIASEQTEYRAFGG